MTETEVKVRVLGGLSDVIPNPTAFQVLSDAYVEMGGPKFDEEDYAIARKFLAILPEDAKKAMVQKMAVLHKMTPEEFEKRPLNSVVIPYSPLMRQKVLTASSDVGDVSYLVPTAQLTASAAIPGTGHHTWQYTAQVGHLHRRKRPVLQPQRPLDWPAPGSLTTRPWLTRPKGAAGGDRRRLRIPDPRRPYLCGRHVMKEEHR